MGLISIDYYNAVRQAKKLQNAAEQCDDAVNAANKVCSEIEQNWSGEAAEAFKLKINEWKKENIQIAEELRDVAQLIKMVAKQIKEADEAAASAMK